MSSYSWSPLQSASGGVPIYPTLSSFPVGATQGDLGVAADTGNLYEFNGSTWVLIAGPGSALSLGNLDAQSPTAKGAALTSGVLSMQSADATHPGLVNNTSQTLSGSKTFSSLINADGGIDRSTSGTLTIGATNSTIINIGNSGATVNIQGTTIYENTPQLLTADPLITVNHGGGAGSGQNAGIQVEEASSITGYAETSTDRNSWEFKAPNTAGIATITPGASGITLNQSSHNPVTIGTANGLSISTQVLSLALSSTSTTGALSSTDWNTFNNKQSTLTLTNLTDVGTDGITIINGSGAVVGSSPVTISQHVADTTHNGYLSSTDWNTFNNKQSTLTLTNLTDAGTDGITITNGTGAVVGASPVTISQRVADTTHNGYLSSTDWNTFNGKVGGASNLTVAGGVTFVASSGVITEDGTNLFWDNSNKRLGIGTATPGAALDVHGVLYLGSTTNAPMITGDDLGAGLNTRLIIQPRTGNQPMASFYMPSGTSTTCSIQANNSSALANRARISNVVSGTSAGVITDYVGAASGITTLSIGEPTISGFTSSIGTLTSIDFRFNNVAAMTMLSSNLAMGIGTASPSAQLDVSSTNTNGTFRVYDQTATTGVTREIIRTGAGQGTTKLTEWQNNAGTVVASVDKTGIFAGIGSGLTSLPAGQLTGAVAIANGGTGQTAKAAAFDALSPMTTGGDIIYGGASGTGTRLANGSSGQVLTSQGGTSAPIWALPAFTPTYIAPTNQVFLSGSGTYNKNYTFVITSGSATAGATYTNNAVTFTVWATVASATQVVMNGSGAPAASGTLTKASGTGDATLTFSAVYAPLFLRVRMVGAGGGGAGAGTSGQANGTDGGNSTFGSSFLTANGGKKGTSDGTANGAGGTTSIAAGALGVGITGGAGNSGAESNASVNLVGGTGGDSIYGGAGAGGTAGANGGIAAATNSGAGGGGGSTNSTSGNQAGGGGGAGGGIDVLVPNPSATYSYAVGAKGTGGAAGTNGGAGAAGGDGLIVVEEYYQ